MIPAHGPLGDVKDLHALTDYLLLARQKVRTMMAKGMPLEAIVKDFHMNEYKGWDRENHFEWLAETLHRELQSMGPQILPSIVEQKVTGTIARLEEEGRRLTRQAGRRPGRAAAHRVRHRHRRCRQRSLAAQGRQKVSATYQVPQGFNAALGYDVIEMIVDSRTRLRSNGWAEQVRSALALRGRRERGTVRRPPSKYRASGT